MPDPGTPVPDAALGRCVGDVRAFLTDRLGTRPHLRTGGGPFDDLLSLEDVDHLLTATGIRRPAVRLVRDGEVVDPAAYTRPARTGSVLVEDLIDPGRLFGAFHDGATVVLQGLHRWWPPLTDFCRDLELALGHPVQANAYLTPPGAAGLAPHHDTHDVFVLQLSGSKHWVLREPLTELPLPGQHSTPEAAAGQPLHREVDLGPGDVLYLPRGHIHAAAAQDGLSLHLTIGLMLTTGRDVLRALVERAGEDIRFRRALPIGSGTDPELAAQAVKQVVADLVDWVAGVDPAEVADDLADRFVSGRRPALTGHLLELAGLDRIDDGTTVARRPRTLHRVRVDGEGLVLVLGDRTVRLPAALEPAVRRLLADGTQRVGDLADLLDPGSRLVLVRRLVREGVLRTGSADG